MASRNSKHRIGLFQRGAKAWSILRPNQQDVYACPICLRPFPSSALDGNGELTIDHVPPEAIGGRTMVLTCRDCNNAAGRRLDHELAALHENIDFVEGTSNGPIRGRLKFDEFSFNVTIEQSIHGGKAEITPKLNDPKAVQSFVEHVKMLQNSKYPGEMEFGLSPSKQFSPGRAELSLLRSGYLIAFATFGYTYILHPALNMVRQQLNDFDTFYLQIVSLTLPGTPRSEKHIRCVIAPDEFRCLMVQFGQHQVLLPWPPWGDTFYVRLAQASTSRRQLPLRVEPDRAPWPKYPQYQLDFMQSTG